MIMIRITIDSASNSSFIQPESVSAAGTAVSDLFDGVHAVRQEAAAEPAAKDAAQEGPQMLDETGAGLDGRGHLLTTPRTHQGHGVRSKLQALAEQHIIIIIVSFFNNVVTL